MIFNLKKICIGTTFKIIYFPVEKNSLTAKFSLNEKKKTFIILRSN